MRADLADKHNRVVRFKLAAAWVLLFSFCFAEPGFSNYSGENSGKTIFRIDIQIQGVNGKTGSWESIARNLIQVKPGDIYDLALMEQAIVRLTDSNMFKSIHVPDPVEKISGVNIRFELLPYGRIKDIRIYKAFPLFDREVLNVMTLYNGDAFIRANLGEQEKRVITLLKKKGFIDPRVTLSVQRDAADGNYVLSVHIDKGEFLRVDRVEIKGNAHFSSTRLKLRTKTWKSPVLFGSARRFVQKDLDEDVKKIISFYRKKGFADVSIQPEIIRDLEEKKVDVIFHVQEGPHYEILIEGNEHFWAYTLKREMTLSRDGNKNNFGLRKSVRLLEKKYVEKGFPDVGIDHGVKETDPTQPLVKQVTLAIDEGDQYRVSKIVLSGNQTISNKEIFKNMLTRESGFGNRGVYVAKILDEDINAILSLYLREGFTRTRVDKHVRILDIAGPDSSEKNRKKVEIKLAIDEGIQTKVDQVQFEGMSALSLEAARELISLKPGQPFRGYMMEDDENRLNQKISELGYPGNKVDAAEEFSPDRSRVNLTYTISQGPYVTVGQVYYVGNFRTKPQILDNEMEVFTGDPLSLAKLLESRRNMMDINALDSVRFRTIGLKNNAPEVDIIVEAEEKKPYFFEMGTGYDTQRHLYLSSAVGDHNFLGRNLDLQLEGEISQIGYKGNISLLEPRFLKTRTWSSTRAFGEKQEEFNKEFGIKSYGVSQNFYQQFLSRNLTVNLGVMYESRKQYLTQDRLLTPDEADEYEPRHIIVVSPGIVYKTTDSYVRPKKGTLSSFNVDFSNGIDNDLDDFIKYRLDTRYYYSLSEPLVIAFRGRYRIIQPSGSSRKVPEDQLFFLGGTSSVRGFDENLLRYDTSGNAVGGRESLLGSVEARYDLGLNFEFSAFYDIGAVRQTQGKGGSDAFRDSVGLGLRYMTPIGPIGFLYGWKLDPMPNESAGSFHFSMGYTF